MTRTASPAPPASGSPASVEVASSGDASSAWARDLRAGVRRPDDLRRLPLHPQAQERHQEAAEAFKVRIPASYLALVDWDDPEDPIARQAVPRADELHVRPGERGDPIGDEAHSPVPHLTHRYPDRVLLYPTYVCSMYCRHCFRKESLNEDDRGVAIDRLEPALAYIAEHTELREVILTGGDPFTLSDAQLARLRRRIEAIPHVRLLRVHTRVPVTLPTRVTPGLVEALRGRLMTAVVTHFNHPREITPDAEVACRRLRDAGLMLLNQSVLLRGVNDDPQTLETLVRELVYTLGAKPYYLHHCDLTRGVSHFRTSIDQGRALIEGLRGRVSGLCLPRYVLDLPGGYGKVPLSASPVRHRAGTRWAFEAWDGQVRPYEECTAESTPAAPEPSPEETEEAGGDPEAEVAAALRTLVLQGPRALRVHAARRVGSAWRGLRRFLPGGPS